VLKEKSEKGNEAHALCLWFFWFFLLLSSYCSCPFGLSLLLAI